MAVFLSLLWLATTIAGIVFLIRPNAKLPPYATRKRAAITLAASFIGLPLLASPFMPDDTLTTSPAASEATNAPAAPARSAEEIEAEALARAERDAKRNPERFLSISNTRATKEGFDTVLELSGRITNASPVTFKDPVVRCELFSETNTRLGSVTGTIYKVVPSNGSMTFSEENMGFAHSDWQQYSCEVRRAVVLE